MRRQDLLHSSYTVARELLTKLLFDCHDTIVDYTSYEYRTIGELTYCISYGGGQEVECSIERVNPSGRIMYYDFVSDEVAKMLRRDMDEIQSQVDELLAAEENEAEHEKFVLARGVDWDTFHSAYQQAKSGNCPFKDKCKRYERTVKKFGHQLSIF